MFYKLTIHVDYFVFVVYQVVEGMSLIEVLRNQIEEVTKVHTFGFIYVKSSIEMVQDVTNIYLVNFREKHYFVK